MLIADWFFMTCLTSTHRRPMRRLTELQTRASWPSMASLSWSPSAQSTPVYISGLLAVNNGLITTDDANWWHCLYLNLFPGESISSWDLMIHITSTNSCRCTQTLSSINGWAILHICSIMLPRTCDNTNKYAGNLSQVCTHTSLSQTQLIYWDWNSVLIQDKHNVC